MTANMNNDSEQLVHLARESASYFPRYPILLVGIFWMEKIFCFPWLRKGSRVRQNIRKARRIVRIGHSALVDKKVNLGVVGLFVGRVKRGGREEPKEKDSNREATDEKNVPQILLSIIHF